MDQHHSLVSCHAVYRSEYVNDRSMCFRAVEKKSLMGNTPNAEVKEDVFELPHQSGTWSMAIVKTCTFVELRSDEQLQPCANLTQ